MAEKYTPAPKRKRDATRAALWEKSFQHKEKDLNNKGVRALKRRRFLPLLRAREFSFLPSSSSSSLEKEREEKCSLSFSLSGGAFVDGAISKYAS